MRFVTNKGEKNVNELATRLFRIQGRGSQAATWYAADTLFRANPQLSDLSKVPEGTLVEVPDNAPSLAPGEQAAAAAALVTSLTARTVQDAFDALQRRLTAIESDATNRMTSGLDRIQTSDLKTELKNASALNLVWVDRLPILDRAKDAKNVLKDAQSSRICTSSLWRN